MKEKIFAQMKEQYKHLGLPTEVMELQSEMLSQQVSEESEIAEKIDGLSSMFEAMQRAFDKRAASAVESYKRKAVAKRVEESVDENGLGVEESESPKSSDELQAYKQETQAMLESMQKEIAELRSKADTTQRIREEERKNALVASIAKDLGLDADLTELAKLRLTEGMSDAEIDKSMCESKKLFMSKGFVADDMRISDKEEAMKHAADDWVKSKQKSE